MDAYPSSPIKEEQTGPGVAPIEMTSRPWRRRAGLSYSLTVIGGLNSGGGRKPSPAVGVPLGLRSQPEARSKNTPSLGTDRTALEIVQGRTRKGVAPARLPPVKLRITGTRGLQGRAARAALAAYTAAARQ